MSSAIEERWRTTLDRHRDQDPPRVVWEVPIDRLVDRQYCANFAKDLEHVAPDGWQRRAAVKTAHKLLPAVPGLYMFVWNPEPVLRIEGSECRTPIILYVGKAGGLHNNSTIRSRYQGEYRKVVGGDPELFWEKAKLDNRKARFSALLSLVPLELWFTEVSEPAKIDQFEERLFNLYSPPLNRRGGPRLRPIKKVNAF